MVRPKLEVADIFRLHGEAWRTANAGHVSLDQRRVMTAIEICRTAELGGHVEQCEDCAHKRISYNSCADRHCPKCQWRSAQRWLAARAAELLPVPYLHLVFRLPAAIGPIAYQNKSKLYALLLKVTAKTLSTIAADRKQLGAEIGITSLLHTWGGAMQYHVHAHCLVPAGGISRDGKSWIACKPGVLRGRLFSGLFRKLFLDGLTAAFEGGELQFFGNLVALKDPNAFAAMLARLRKIEWSVYGKTPLGGPQRVLAYLARYTHRVAVTNNRLVDLDETHVSFREKEDREHDGHHSKVVRLEIGEFIRRFLLHVLPDGFQRIRHYGFLANAHRADKLALCRSLLDVRSGSTAPSGSTDHHDDAPTHQIPRCPCCGGRMKIIQTFDGPSSRPYHVRKLDGL